MDDVKTLLAVLPKTIADNLENPESLLEIILDEERPVEYRYLDGSYIEVVDMIVTAAMLQQIEKKVGSFGPTNRAGISKTLHRISRIQNRFGATVGMTCRVGRPFEGCVKLIEDFVTAGHNILLLGKPGIGKTTKLRDIARLLSSVLNKRVVVVDTSNEIGGDGTLPHSSIGRSRRMQMPPGKQQHAVMKEAVENHMPEAIIVDEISDSQETEAARTISQRGVQLIATAHGSKLFELLQNPPLCGLIGGVKTVTVSDDHAKIHGGRKSIQERQFPPVFDVVVELSAFDQVEIYTDLPKVIDALLAGDTVQGEVRRIKDGIVRTLYAAKITSPTKDTRVEDDPGTIGGRIRVKPKQTAHTKTRR